MVEQLNARTFALAAAIFIGGWLLAEALLRLSSLWMLVFGSVIVAVVLRAIADPLVARFRWPDGLAVFTAVLLVLVLLGAVSFLFGQQIAEQMDQLAQTVPAAWEHLQARISSSPTARQVMDRLQEWGAQAGGVLARAPGLLLSWFTALTTLVLVLVAGLFLAMKPRPARDGALAMLPLAWRSRGKEVMNACGQALKGWLKAQLVSMTLVGLMVGIGLWAIGVPAPLALGLFAGVAQFVPVVGPIVAAVPALIIAATAGGKVFALALALFIGASQLEANVITPLVQKNVAALPVVLGIFGVVALGTLFGPLGVLFATPLTVVLYTAFNLLYRRDLLGDVSAPAPGTS